LKHVRKRVNVPGFWLKTYKKILTLVIILTFLTSAISQESDSISSLKNNTQFNDTLQLALQEAIFLGLKNNPTVTIQKLNPEIMNTFAREYRATFDPVVSADGQRSEVKSQRRLGADRIPYDLRDNRFDYELRLSETLPTGTSISANVGMTGSVSNLYTDQFTGSVGLTFTQALLQGFGFGANLANLRKARLDVEISEFELKGIAESVTGEIEKSYWNLYMTGQEIDIQQKSLELAQKQLVESLERVAVGKLPELELAAVDAEVAVRKGALIDAQSRYEQGRLRFLYLLNPQSENYWTTLPLLLDKPFLPIDTLENVSEHEKLGIKFRPDLEQARLSYKKGQLDVARTKNGLLPQLDLFISLGRTSYSEVFREAYPDLRSPFYQVNAGVTFVFPIPNRRESAQLARARFSNEQQALAVQNMEKLVQWDIRSAYAEVLRTKQQIDATQVTRTMQEKKLDAELEKFRVGKSTNILVLQAQRDFIASQLDEVRSMVEYLYALIDLYIAEGTLLERRGINSLSN
jgi:outer membrane protein